MGEANRSPDVGYDLASPFLLTPGSTRLIQIQPTQRCNLRCIHCYSESGPDRQGDLPYKSLVRFLAEARDLGYNYVGVSGGEPLLWKDLDRFLDFARDTGFSTSVSTNGTLLDRSRAARFRGRAGLVAVSVDGPPDDHALMRGSKTAFRSMRAGLSALRDEAVPFALAFTLTRHNADRLRWLYEFADEVGAAAIHVHPLCNFGAASEHLSDAIPDSLEFKTAAWLLALLVEFRGAGGPVVTLDVIQRALVERSCWPMLAEDEAELRTAPFADIVPSLVIETDGCIVPFIYGFPRLWSVGVIGREPLASAVGEFRTRCAAPLSGLVRSTLKRLAMAEEEYVDLFAELLASAHRYQAQGATRL